MAPKQQQTCAPQGKLLANFMESRGCRVVEAAGCFWYSQQGRFFSALPDQLEIDPDPAEIDDLLREHSGLGARYLAANRVGLESGLYVCRKTDYDLEDVKSTLRRKIRKALKNFDIRPCEKKELLEQGIVLNRETMSRQRRGDDEFTDPKKWTRLVAAAELCEGIDTLGAFADGKLGAYMITYVEHGWFNILHQFSSRAMLPMMPNDGLVFLATKSAIERPDVEVACFGTEGLSSGAGLHDFKLRYGYVSEPRSWGVRWNPTLAPILSNGLAGSLATWARNTLPYSDRLGKMESMMVASHRTRCGVEARRRAIGGSLA